MFSVLTEKRPIHCIDGENLEDQHSGNDMVHLADTSGSSSTRDTDLSNLSEKVEKVTKPQKKIPWTEAERAAVHRHLGQFILLGKLPGKSEIEMCQKQCPCLCNRKWTNIKDYVRNTILSAARRRKKYSKT